MLHPINSEVKINDAVIKVLGLKRKQDIKINILKQDRVYNIKILASEYLTLL